MWHNQCLLCAAKFLGVGMRDRSQPHVSMISGWSRDAWMGRGRRQAGVKEKGAALSEEHLESNVLGRQALVTLPLHDTVATECKQSRFFAIQKAQTALDVHPQFSYLWWYTQPSFNSTQTAQRNSLGAGWRKYAAPSEITGETFI